MIRIDLNRRSCSESRVQFPDCRQLGNCPAAPADGLIPGCPLDWSASRGLVSVGVQGRVSSSGSLLIETPSETLLEKPTSGYTPTHTTGRPSIREALVVRLLARAAHELRAPRDGTRFGSPKGSSLVCAQIIVQLVTGARFRGMQCLVNPLAPFPNCLKAPVRQAFRRMDWPLRRCFVTRL